jgi:hypothetical protein
MDINKHGIVLWLTITKSKSAGMTYKKAVCSALLVPMKATKDNPFQIGGMTLNIWIETNLGELLMASQIGTILIL